ncbi:MAG: hypothetical protein MK226_21585 [Saprospiraceae bacterium]|nr:hypothetical protein [Saprospiraceae bacterium]
MSAAQIRAEIDSYLDQVKDENFLKVVHLMLNSYVKVQEPENDPIIGYEIDGTAVHASTARKEFEADIEAARRGEYITLEDLEKEAETW